MFSASLCSVIQFTLCIENLALCRPWKLQIYAIHNAVAISSNCSYCITQTLIARTLWLAYTQSEFTSRLNMYRLFNALHSAPKQIWSKRVAQLY